MEKKVLCDRCKREYVPWKACEELERWGEYICPECKEDSEIE